MYKTAPFDSIYGNRENFSLLVTGYRAVYAALGQKTKVPVAVLGFEMVYDSFAKLMIEASDDACKVCRKERYIL